MCTNNSIIVRKPDNKSTIICMQKKADKIIPTEENIIEANKLAFNDDIGVVTNHVTSMFEVQAGFPKDSDEYKELEYRIMCGQLYQQNTIDRSKGIIAKPMPSYWYTTRTYGNENYNPTDEERKFNLSIMASHKPYFMTYVYPKLRTENNKHIKNSNSSVARRFRKYKIKNMQDLIQYQNKTEDMSNCAEYFKNLSPVGNNPCIINRIAWLFEKEFKGYLSKLAKMAEQDSELNFDYNILKSDVEYSKAVYNQISEVYKKFKEHTVQELQRRKKEKIDHDYSTTWYQVQLEYFKSECYRICANENELCNIILDLCYQAECSKQFVWSMCGDVILDTLLKRNGYKITYPFSVEEQVQFKFFGRNFVMREKGVEGNMNDYTE